MKATYKLVCLKILLSRKSCYILKIPVYFSVKYTTLPLQITSSHLQNIPSSAGKLNNFHIDSLYKLFDFMHDVYTFKLHFQFNFFIFESVSYLYSQLKPWFITQSKLLLICQASYFNASNCKCTKCLLGALTFMYHYCKYQNCIHVWLNSLFFWGGNFMVSLFFVCFFISCWCYGDA